MIFDYRTVYVMGTLIRETARRALYLLMFTQTKSFSWVLFEVGQDNILWLNYNLFIVQMYVILQKFLLNYSQDYDIR